MEAIALLLEASEVHAKAEAKYASSMDVADAEEAGRDFEGNFLAQWPAIY